MANASVCKSCGAEIVWLETPTGAYTPCNPGTVQIAIGTGEVVKGIVISVPSVLFGYVSHFSTCPNAARHRKKNGAKVREDVLLD